MAENQQKLYEQQSEMIRQITAESIGEKQLSQTGQIAQQESPPEEEDKQLAGPPASIEDLAKDFHTKLTDLAELLPGLGDIADKIQFNHTEDNISLVYAGRKKTEIGTWGNVDVARHTLNRLIGLLDVILIHIRGFRKGKEEEKQD